MEANCDSANISTTPSIDKEESTEKNFVNNGKLYHISQFMVFDILTRTRFIIIPRVVLPENLLRIKGKLIVSSG